MGLESCVEKILHDDSMLKICERVMDRYICIILREQSFLEKGKKEKNVFSRFIIHRAYAKTQCQRQSSDIPLGPAVSVIRNRILSKATVVVIE